MSVAIGDDVWVAIDCYVRVCGGDPSELSEDQRQRAARELSAAINRQILRSVRNRLAEALDSAEKLYSP